MGLNLIVPCTEVVGLAVTLMETPEKKVNNNSISWRGEKHTNCDDSNGRGERGNFVENSNPSQGRRGGGGSFFTVGRQKKVNRWFDGLVRTNQVGRLWMPESLGSTK